jgi:hypothetical protein
MNDTVKVGAPSGAAAYNVQGSTLDATAPSSPKRNITYKIIINYSNLE